MGAEAAFKFIFKVSIDEFLEIVNGKDGAESDEARKVATTFFKDCTSKKITWKKFQIAYQRFEKKLRKSHNHKKIQGDFNIGQLFQEYMANKQRLRSLSIAEIERDDSEKSDGEAALPYANNIVPITCTPGATLEHDDLAPLETPGYGTPTGNPLPVHDHLGSMAMSPGAVLNFETVAHGGGRGSVYSNSGSDGASWQSVESLEREGEESMVFVAGNERPRHVRRKTSITPEGIPEVRWYYRFADQRAIPLPCSFQIVNKNQVGPVTAEVIKGIIRKHGSENIELWNCYFEPSEYKLASKMELAQYGLAERRRMAQREFSKRRDSPVMVRLLEQIIAAQNK